MFCRPRRIVLERLTLPFVRSIIVEKAKENQRRQERYDSQGG
jgi:hypothetical protein